MSVSNVNIEGYENFVNYIKNLETETRPVYIYFSGSKTSEGVSWCPDCVEAEPVLLQFINNLKRDIVFVYVDVGNREYWKDLACPFRTNPHVKLMVLPSLLKWREVKRLEGSQCANNDLLVMMFEDDDD